MSFQLLFYPQIPHKHPYKNTKDVSRQNSLKFSYLGLTGWSTGSSGLQATVRSPVPGRRPELFNSDRIIRSVFGSSGLPSLAGDRRYASPTGPSGPRHSSIRSPVSGRRPELFATHRSIRSADRTVRSNTGPSGVLGVLLSSHKENNKPT